MTSRLRQRPRFWRAPLVVCFVVALTQLAASRVQASGPPIPGASTPEHLWFVVEEQRPEREDLPRLFRLYHHAGAMSQPTLSSDSMVPALSQYPEAIAAWESQVWLVNQAQPNHEPPRREVFTLRVQYDPTFEIYHHEPRERLQSVESLPAEGKLAGFVALARGPVALLMPTERGTAGVVGSDGEPRNAGELAEPRLLALENGLWTDLMLPDDFPADAIARLGASQAGDGTLYLFVARLGPGQSTATLYRLISGEWQRSTIPLDLSRVRQMTNVLDQCVAVLDQSDDSPAAVAIIRPQDVLSVATFAAPDSPWTVLGLASNLRLISRGVGEQIFMQRIDPVTGDISEREQFIALRPSAVSLVHLPLLLLIAIVAVSIAYALGKHNMSAPLELPPGYVVLGPMGRLLAFGIDLVPAGLITMFLLRCEFAELLRPPLFVARLDQSIPYLVMAGLTILHSGVWELLTGASLGKSLVHARVTDLRGRRLPAGRTLARLAFKAVVLYVPLLAVFNLMNNRGQGLGDRAVGAAVITEQEQPPKPE